MRNQWLRSLLLCRHTPSHQPYVTQVNRHLRSFTSALVRPRAPHVTPKPFPLRRHFTSSPEVTVDPPKPPSDQATLLADAFANPGRSSDEIKLDLDSKSVVVTLDLVLRVLKDPDTDTDVAKRVLNWVLENELFASASKNYNTSKGRELEKICSSITRIVRGESWGNDVEKKLRELNVEFSSDLVVDVLEHLELEPNNKALIFFRWVEESDLFKHDERSYNAIARVLSREDESEKFWKIVDEMRSAGHEMERKTCIDIFERFVERKMIKDAVGLCEFAATQKRLLQDMDLFLQVLRVLKAKVNDGSDSVS